MKLEPRTLEIAMPGGNSTARPSNRKEKKAAKVMSEYQRQRAKIYDRFYDGDLTVEGMDRLLGNLNGPNTADAYSTLENRDEKEMVRKGSKRLGYKEGGAVETSLRPKSRSSVSKRPPKFKTIGGGMTDGTRGPSPMRSETQMFRDGGEVRGCKSSQMTGKGFSGSY
tara:strand:+ start:664 stop:1164 length:501 start_codon:yes stop_codon:yes gene_type:complete